MPTYRDLEAARAVVVVDLDPHEESPILWLRLRKAALRRGVPVVAVGSRPGRLAEFATVVPTRPGGQAEALEGLGRGDGEAGRLLTGEGDGEVIVLAGWRGGFTGGLAAAARLAATLGGRFAWVPRRAGDRGALDAGARPGLLPGGRAVGDATARSEFAKAWGPSCLTGPAWTARPWSRSRPPVSSGCWSWPGSTWSGTTGPGSWPSRPWRRRS